MTIDRDEERRFNETQREILDAIRSIGNISMAEPDVIAELLEAKVALIRAQYLLAGHLNKKSQASP